MKTLLATTAVFAISAGMASAEISLSGSARMGIIDDFGDVGPVFSSRVRIVFTASGETDTGLSFGASMRADQDGGNTDGTRNDDSTVFISGAFGKLTMGDVDSAAQSAVGQVDGVGFTGLGDLNEMIFVATGGLTISEPIASAIGFSDGWQMNSDTSVLYEYSTGSLAVYLSATQREYDDGFGGGPDESYSLGAAYTMGDYKVSVGYEAVETLAGGSPDGDIYHWIVGGDATFGSVVLKARYGQADIDGGGTPRADATQYALSATYTSGPMGLTGFYSNKNFDDTAGAQLLDISAIGLGATYDLGGGASVAGGVVERTIDDGATETSDTGVDIGLNFSF